LADLTVSGRTDYRMLEIDLCEVELRTSRVDLGFEAALPAIGQSCLRFRLAQRCESLTGRAPLGFRGCLARHWPVVPALPPGAALRESDRARGSRPNRR